MRRLAVALALLAACSSPRQVGRSAPPTTAAESPEPREAPPAAAAADPKPACPAVDEAKLEPPECKDPIASTPIPPIVDPKETLGHVYEGLVSLARGTSKGPVRFAMYGDSNHKMDGPEAHLRRALQARFGDAGHGWVPLARPHWIQHQDVKHDGTWKVFKSWAISTDPIIRDRNYGLGNMFAETEAPGGMLYVATADEKAPIGQKVSRFDVFFLKRPDGGNFDIVADGTTVKHVSTRAADWEAGVETVKVEDGPHKLSVVTRGQGMVRFFGVAMERDVPGIVVDSLPTGAMNIHQMSWVNPTTRQPMATARGWDLVMIHLGTTMSQLVFHKPALTKVVEEMKAALPNAAILLLSPPDYLRDKRGPDSEPRIIKVSQQIREVAEETGVAFWDYRAAMGGDGSMATFIRKNLVTSDRVHLFQSGHDVMMDRLIRALFLDLAHWREKHPDAGCH
jgi:hypothetical protein